MAQTIDSELPPCGQIRLGDGYDAPPSLPTCVDAKRVTLEVRRFILPYLTRLHGGPRLERPIAETSSMSSQIFPEAAYEELRLASIFLTLQFICDDLFDGQDVLDELRAIPAAQPAADVLQRIRERPSLVADGTKAILQVLRDPYYEPAALPPGSAIRDVFLFDAFAECARLLADYGHRCPSPYYGAWLNELGASLARFSASHGQIYRDIDRLSVEEYSAHKLTNCGMHHTILMMEFATRSILSPEQRQQPLLTSLERHCRHLGSLLNEVISYEKEALRERSGNLVTVIMSKRCCDLRTAVDAVLRLARGHAERLAQARQQAMAAFCAASEEHQLLRRWVRGIDSLAAGCWHWQITGTTRYQSSTSPFVELCTPSVAEPAGDAPW